MSRRIFLVLCVLSWGVWLAGCSGGKQVTRVDVEEQIDLSGEWNDVDSQKVSAALVDQISHGVWIEDFRAEKGKKPTLIIGRVYNKTPEHLATQTFIADLERNFINGGRVFVVGDPQEREQIRAERADQQEYASEATMKEWGREQGADFMFIGEVNSLFDQEEGDQVKYYQVDCYLVDLETNVKVWAGFEKIKKFVGRSKYKG